MLQSFLTVGRQIITLYLLLVVGFVLGKVKILDDRASTAMSNLVMYVVSPCMMIVALCSACSGVLGCSMISRRSLRTPIHTR